MFARLTRISGLGFGAATHALFLVTVWYLVRFLHADTLSVPGRSPQAALGLNLLLAVQFAVGHSLLLHPAVRQPLGRWISRPFYGCFFCVVTCLSLLGMIAGWRSVEPVIWRLDGWEYRAVELAFVGAWCGLLYSLFLAGLGYQTGFTPWWQWVRGRRVENRAFHPRGVFLLLRHPVYLSFMGLIWLNPVMTLDRLLLALLWSAYILVGSWLKDQRMEYFLGETYVRYEEQVPGYPLIPFGPLALRPRSSAPQGARGTIARQPGAAA